MKHTPYPGYENHFKSQLKGDSEDLNQARIAQREAMLSFTVPEGMIIENRVIPGADGQDMNIRIYKPANLTGDDPMILEVHGGGFVGGNLEIDNARCAALATRIPAIVIGVEYRLASETVHFPTPLMDVHAAYLWALEHAKELGSNGKIGTHGSSAGANLVGGLALYLRDHKEQMPVLTVMNCPPTRLEQTSQYSFHQNFQLRLVGESANDSVEAIYLGGFNGETPSYYAFPGYCHDLGFLGPHMILAAEYDMLRDDGLEYAMRLLKAGVPTEIFTGGRACHCWSCAPHPYTDLTHDVIAMAFKREFGLLDHLKKCEYSE